MLRLRHGAAGDIGSRAEMQDCNIGYDSYAALGGVGHAAAAANGNENVSSHAFYGVRAPPHTAVPTAPAFRSFLRCTALRILASVAAMAWIS